jgi:tetratricopeptide (TPR) repeat protein
MKKSDPAGTAVQGEDVRMMMDKRKNAVSRRLLPFIVLVLALFPVAGCDRDRQRNSETLARRMAEMDGRREEVTREKLEEYKGKIARVEKDVEKVISGVQELGTFYELLGMKYMDLGMPLEAHESFAKAADIYPEKETLLYYRGLSAAIVAKTRETDDEAAEWLERAETSYRQAIRQNDRFSLGYYSLAVLYIYELYRPEEAVPLLEKYIEIEPGDPRGRFLLGQLYQSFGMNEKAAMQYNEVVRLGRDEELVNEAKNRLSELGGM